MSNIRIVNLATHTTPAIVEDNRKQWVAYGGDNNYFQYLIDRYNGSATNNAIINGMTAVSYTHLRAHETREDRVWRLVG